MVSGGEGAAVELCEGLKMNWFISYAQVYKDGGFKFGHCVTDNKEHPLARCARWTKDYGKIERFKVILLSFQEVDPSIPIVDELSDLVG